jgi:hypothetical protein
MISIIDYERALEVKDIDGFRVKLDKLQREYCENAPRHVVMPLYPILELYDQFA